MTIPAFNEAAFYADGARMINAIPIDPPAVAGIGRLHAPTVIKSGIIPKLPGILFTHMPGPFAVIIHFYLFLAR